MRHAAITADLRYAARRLWRSPGFLFATVATLALGVGLNTAIFALIDQVLLRPLPYAESDRLVAITSTRDGEERSMSWPDFADWREQNESFSEMAAFWRNNLVITSDGAAEQVRGLEVTPNLFRTLGVSPMIGHEFPDSYESPGAPREVILTHGLWQTRYGSDASVVGRTVILDGEAYEIAGVMPPGFEFPAGIFLGTSDLYLPAGLSTGSDSWLDRDDHPGIYAIGRLKAGVDLPRARRDLEMIAANLRETYPESNDRTGVQAEPAISEVAGELSSTLKLLFLGVLAVLLIAIANVSGIAAARSFDRQHEIAVRSAVGASRGRIVRVLLAEYALIGLLSFCAAVLVAWGGIRLAAPLLEGLPRLQEITPDVRVFLFGFTIAIGAALVAGLVPSWRAAARSDAPSLRMRFSTTDDRRLARGALVTVQIGLALVLLTGSLLLTKTLLAIRADDGGIRPAGVLTFRLTFPDARYDDDALRTFHEEFLERVAAVPGVSSAAGISTLPFSGAGRQSGMHRIGEPEHDAVPTDIAVVTPEYFETMGVDLLRGRTFRESDGPSDPTVAVVDERFAERFWPGDDPIGKRVGGWGFHEIEIVGLARHVKNYGVQADSRGELYLPYAQRPMSIMYGLVRTGEDPVRLAPVVRGIVTEVDPSLPIGAIETMSEVVAGTRTTSELAALIAIVLSALAVLLSAIGLYSLLAWEVLRRRREIGIRMALGADQRSILELVGRRGAWLALAGGIVGLVATAWLVRFLESFLYGVEPFDVSVVAGSVALMAIVVIAASVVPMLRASQSDPATILREGS